jgi:hypothetical protein
MPRKGIVMLTAVTLPHNITCILAVGKDLGPEFLSFNLIWAFQLMPPYLHVRGSLKNVCPANFFSAKINIKTDEIRCLLVLIT